MGGGQDPTFPLFIPLLLLLSLAHISPTAAQTPVRPPAVAAAPPPLSPADACVGIFLTYSGGRPTRIHPIRRNNPSQQPYAVTGTAVISNFDSVPLEAWNLVVGYPNGTVLVSVTSAVLSDGSILPYIVGQNGTAGASFSGSPNPDLKTAIETAGDNTQTQTRLTITTTQFGLVPNKTAVPASIALDNPGYICPAPTVNMTADPQMFVCCLRDPNYKANASAISEKVQPRRNGDLSITYDVIQSYGSSYLALVTIENNSPLGRLDNWQLNWRWMHGEFINKMQGAVTNLTDASECINGKQGQYYKDLDFSRVLNCERQPTIVDLPLQLANDTIRGRIPFCCRNGTILPAAMDPTKSSSAFQIEVYKMPPDLNRTVLYPPEIWRIKGSPAALNPDYKCSAPIRVAATLVKDPSGLPTSDAALATWQVVCNITRPANAKPRCCVSFSAFYNDSVVPCSTCACGCPASVGKTCSTTAPAMLLPPDGVLVPFDNRSVKAVAWAGIKHLPVPNPMPCGDYCGLSVNWHVYTDYTGGWSARITLFNWEDIDLPDWFAAVVLPKAYNGFEAMYSFNGTAIGNDTIFMQGLPGLNYLIKENLEANPRDPGKLQTVISFSKKNTSGIDVPAGDGFPTKLIFNGEECALPHALPANKGPKLAAASYSILLGVALFTSTVLMIGL